MSMKFVHFDNGTVLIIAIAIYIAILNSPGHLYTVCTALHICFVFNQVHLEAFGPNQKFVHPFKAFNMSMKFPL